MRLMYVHAYQSYVWNRVVSRRIHEFGLVLRPGDLAFRETTMSTDLDIGTIMMAIVADVVIIIINIFNVA